MQRHQAVTYAAPLHCRRSHTTLLAPSYHRQHDSVMRLLVPLHCAVTASTSPLRCHQCSSTRPSPSIQHHRATVSATPDARAVTIDTATSGLHQSIIGAAPPCGHPCSSAMLLPPPQLYEAVASAAPPRCRQCSFAVLLLPVHLHRVIARAALSGYRLCSSATLLLLPHLHRDVTSAAPACSHRCSSTVLQSPP
jgi:hypothetical protein